MTIGKQRMGIIVQVLEIEGRPAPLVSADLYYMDGPDRKNNARLLNFVQLDLEEGLAFDVIEQYAVAAGRAVARALESLFYERVENGTNVKTDDFQKRM